MTNRIKTTGPESSISGAQKYRELTFRYIKEIKTDEQKNRICLINGDKRRERKRERKRERDKSPVNS